MTRRDVAVGSLFAAIYLATLCATLDIGISRDESFYFSAGEQYSHWFDDLLQHPRQAFSKASVDRHFAANPEHPALPKLMFGASWRLFGAMHDPKTEPWTRDWYERSQPPRRLLGWLSESTAMRLPALLLNSLLVLLIYLFGAEFFGRRVAVATTLAWMLQPHAFWHAHISCFDMPITTMWFATGWAFLKSVTRGPDGRGAWRWAALTGVLWGLALSTKHNAYFLPPTFLLWWLLARRRDFHLDRGGLRIPAVPLAFLAMVAISPLVYYATWPKLWYDPLGHLKWYFERHAEHEYYWAYFWRVLYTKPPFPLGYSFLMSAITIPGPLLALSLTGLLRLVGERLTRLATTRPSGVVIFVLLNAFVPFAVIANGKVPIFGGTKHWLPGVPYLAILAGIGFVWLWDALGDLAQRLRPHGARLARTALATLAFLACFAAPAFDTLHGHTNGTTYFNAFAGGYAAMGEHGLEREFWGNTAVSALAYVNAHAATGARVHFDDTTYDAVRMYWRDGKLRRDIVPVWDLAAADWFLFHWHKEFLDHETQAKAAFQVQVPVFVVAQDGVPLLNVYQRAPARGGPP